MTLASLPSREAGCRLTSLAGADGEAKVATFLDAVRTDEIAFNWELTLAIGGQPTVLHFTGGREQRRQLIHHRSNDTRGCRSLVQHTS